MTSLQPALKSPWGTNTPSEGWSFAGVDGSREAQRNSAQIADLRSLSTGHEQRVRHVDMLTADGVRERPGVVPGSALQKNGVRDQNSSSEKLSKSNQTQLKRMLSKDCLRQANDAWDVKRRKIEHSRKEQSRAASNISPAGRTQQMNNDKSGCCSSEDGTKRSMPSDAMLRNGVISFESQPLTSPAARLSPSSNPSTTWLSSSQICIKEETEEPVARAHPQANIKTTAGAGTYHGSRALPIFLEDDDSDNDLGDDLSRPLPILKRDIPFDSTSKFRSLHPNIEQKLAQKTESDRIRQENIAKKHGGRARGDALGDTKATTTSLTQNPASRLDAVPKQVLSESTLAGAQRRPRREAVTSGSTLRNTTAQPERGSGKPQDASGGPLNITPTHLSGVSTMNSILRSIHESSQQLPTTLGAQASSMLMREGGGAKELLADTNKVHPKSSHISSHRSQTQSESTRSPREQFAQGHNVKPSASLAPDASPGTSPAGDQQNAAKLRQQLAAKVRAEHDAKNEREAARRAEKKLEKDLKAINEAKRQRAAERLALTQSIKAQEKEAEEVRDRNASFTTLMSVAAQIHDGPAIQDAKPVPVDDAQLKSHISDYQRAILAAKGPSNSHDAQTCPLARGEANQAMRIKLAEERNAGRRRAEEQAARQRKTLSSGLIEEHPNQVLQQLISAPQQRIQDNSPTQPVTDPVSLNSTAGQARLANSSQRPQPSVTAADLWLLEQRIKEVSYADLVQPCARLTGTVRTEKQLSSRFATVKKNVAGAGISAKELCRLKTDDGTFRSELHHKFNLQVIEDPWEHENIPGEPKPGTRTAAIVTGRSSSNNRSPTGATSISDDNASDADTNTLVDDVCRSMEDRETEDLAPRPNISGKSIGGASLAHYAEILAEIWEEQHQKPRIFREPSPIERADFCHWVYQVVRREISRDAIEADEDIEEFPWEICNQDFEDKLVANHAASIEATKFLDPENAVCGSSKGTTITNRFDDDGMLIARLTVEDGAIAEAQVVRYMRTVQDGISPSSKEDWAPTSVYMVYRQTMKTKTGDGLFEETSKTDKITLFDDKVFTDVDMANECAARTFVNATYRPTTTHLTRRDEEVRARVEEHLYGLDEEDGELFNKRCPQEGEQFTRVWVQQGRLLGPRN